MSVSVSMSGAVGLGLRVGSYLLGVYVPLKALFFSFFHRILLPSGLIQTKGDGVVGSRNNIQLASLGH